MSVFEVCREEGLKSVYPCTEYLTFGPWLYLVPQYKPESVLILGFAGGTVAGLIRLVYGDGVRIVGVDSSETENLYGAEVIHADARDYLRTAEHFDVLVIDLFEGLKPCPFIFESWFADMATARCDYLILHAFQGSDTGAYGSLRRIKTLALDDRRFHYFAVNRVPLPVR